MSRCGRTLLAGALAATLIMAGCGEGAESTTSAQIPRPVFLERADAVCKRTYDEVRSGYESFTDGVEGEPFSQIEEIEEYAETVLIPAKRQEVEELRALDAPKGDEARVEAILAAYEEGIEAAEASARDAVTSTAGVFVKATELAQAYGLKDCRY